MPKAAMVARLVGVTPQHALGGLIEWWSLCGDPRDIERLLISGKREVVLPREDIERRFSLAMDKRATAEDLCLVGLLERRDAETYRVRGMSRFFGPVERRLQARAAAVAGGVASAKKRKESTGSAQPRFDTGSGVASASVEPLPKRPRSDRRSAPEATAEATVEAESNTADSGQRTADSLIEKHTCELALVEPGVAILRQRWNELTSPPIPRWTTGRDQDATRALRRRPLAEWEEVFRRINASPFCRGETEGGWKADIDWALRPKGKKPETALKVLEGAYDRGPPRLRAANGPIEPTHTHGVGDLTHEL